MRFRVFAPFHRSLTAQPDDASKSGSAPARSWLNFTLRTKGGIAFAAFVLYLVLIGLAVAYEKQKLANIGMEIRYTRILEEVISDVSTVAAHLALDLDKASIAGGSFSVTEDSAAEAMQSAVKVLKALDPALAGDIERLERNIAVLGPAPSDARLLQLQQDLHGLLVALQDVASKVRHRRQTVLEHRRLANDELTLVIAISGLIGAVVIGVAGTLFLNRLVWDLGKLEKRALEIVTGYRGAPLPVTRHDEVGGLIQAVNHMQLVLREREQLLELSREQRFHHEKMAAVGSLAAAVAHEINNPIAAISGIAHDMADVRNAGNCRGLCQADLIVQHTERIASITRRIATLTAPQSPEPQLLDLNALVENTCNFVGYDKRFEGIDLSRELDRGLPAVEAIPDQVTQVLMNLLINAADAMEGTLGRKPTIRVATGVGDAEVLLAVSDNGRGMERAVLSRVFQEFFTTKPAGKGGGLGLFLCKSLVEGGGGRIELDSTPGVGTEARVHLPLRYRNYARV